MGGRKVAIVAVGPNGDILSYYSSISEAARMNHLYKANISKAIKKHSTYRKIKWMYESEYRELWMQKRTGELSFSIHQLRSEAALKGWEGRTKEQREKHRESCRRRRIEYLKTHPASPIKKRGNRGKPILCITTGKVYPSATRMSIEIGVCRTAVTHAARSGYKVKKLLVKYISKEDYNSRIKNNN
jgi:hypothetical protein